MHNNFLVIIVFLLLTCILSSKSPMFYSPLSPEITLHGRYYTDGNNQVAYDWPCFKISFCFVDSSKVIWNV